MNTEEAFNSAFNKEALQNAKKIETGFLNRKIVKAETLKDSAFSSYANEESSQYGFSFK